jgi:hypothetical protein
LRKLGRPGSQLPSCSGEGNQQQKAKDRAGHEGLLGKAPTERDAESDSEFVSARLFEQAAILENFENSSTHPDYLFSSR